METRMSFTQKEKESFVENCKNLEMLLSKTVEDFFITKFYQMI